MAFKLASAFVEIGTRDRNLKSGFASARSFIGGAAAQMAKLAAGAGTLIGIGGGLAAAGFGIKLAADAEQAEIAFGTMLGSAERAKALLADLNQFAASTPFQLPGIVQSARNLVAFGFEQEKVLPTLKALGDVSAGIGAPLEQIAELFGKAKVQGRLFQEDINQLTGRGIPIIQELAKQLGVTESEVKDLVSSGQVDFSNLERAFIDLTSEGGKFAGLMAAQSKSLSGLWSTFKDNVSASLREVGKVLIDTFDLKGLLERSTNFVQQFQPMFIGALKQVGGFASTIFNFMSTRLQDDVNFMGQTLVSGIGGWLKNLKELSLGAVEWFAVIVGNWDTSLTLMTTEFRLWAQTVVDIAKSLPAQFEQISFDFSRATTRGLRGLLDWLIEQGPAGSAPVAEELSQFLGTMEEILDADRPEFKFQPSEEAVKLAAEAERMRAFLQAEKQKITQERKALFRLLGEAPEVPGLPPAPGPGAAGAAGAAAATGSQRKGGFIALDELSKRIQQRFLDQSSPEMKQLDVLEKQLDKQDEQLRQDKEAEKVLNRIEIQMSRQQRVVLRQATA